MIFIEIDDKPDSNWNNRLIKSNEGTIFQTGNYGMYLKTINKKPSFLKFLDNERRIVGQILISSSSSSNKKGLFSKLLNHFPLKANEIIKWSNGPVIFDNTFSTEIYNLLWKHISELNCYFKGTTHPFSKKHIIEKKNLNFIPWCTFLINLTKDRDDIFNKIDKHSGQKNIRRAIDRGVIVEEITRKNISEYNDLLNEKFNSLQANIVPLEERLNYWEAMKPLGYRGFLAKKDGKPIGGLFFSYFNKYIIEGGLARSPIDYTEKLYSQDLIKWKIIEWGIENKMNWFDLAGANVNPKNQKEEGILRYKKKWGGKQFNYFIITNMKNLNQ